MSVPTIAVAALTTAMQSAASDLAERLQLPLVTVDASTYTFLLVYTENYLEIRTTTQTNLSCVYIDFLHGKADYRRRHTSIKQELLARAVGVKGNYCLNVLDATAGFGRDSFLLTHLGCRVTMLERSPIITALLQDGLARLMANIDHQEKYKLSLQSIDALTYLMQLSTDALPDVIYLDPMYPARTKTALVKKEMQLLHHLVGTDADAAQVFTLALQRARKRVVVKRPKSAPALCLRAPTIVYAGKHHRFDVYLLHS